jgi:hypothetical protein
MSSETHRRATEARADEAGGNAGADAPGCGIMVWTHPSALYGGIRTDRDRTGEHDCHAGPSIGGLILNRTGCSQVHRKRGVAIIVVVMHHRALPASFVIITRTAIPTRSSRFSTCGRLYLCDALIEGLAQDPQDMAAALRPCIQQEHPMVRQRHLARHGDLPAADQAHLREGVRRARHRRIVPTAVAAPMRAAT